MVYSNLINIYNGAFYVEKAESIVDKLMGGATIKCRSISVVSRKIGTHCANRKQKHNILAILIRDLKSIQ